ncbi:MAG: hypothetical protein PHH43_06900 [Candidatus Cloacimonetes bacterium]|nr:hypothetical protein [Candidatus Cloacimonadota bacterium]
MKYIGSFFQFLAIAIAIYVVIRERMNKSDKNTWGREPESIYDIVNIKAPPQQYPQVKIEVRAKDHYVYIRNSGDETAKSVVLHSQELEPLNGSDDANGHYIRPGEEITYFAAGLKNKITRVTISWMDHKGTHKQSFFVKHERSIDYIV